MKEWSEWRSVNVSDNDEAGKQIQCGLCNCLKCSVVVGHFAVVFSCVAHSLLARIQKAGCYLARRGGGQQSKSQKQIKQGTRYKQKVEGLVWCVSVCTFAMARQLKPLSNVFGG